MGGSSWSDAAYRSRVKESVLSHGTAFTYDDDVRKGKASGIHPLLDPKGLKFRESRDSDTHPESNATVVGLDVTGSMGAVVHPIHDKLPLLMGLLTRKNYIPHPQILFGAVGDATCDDVPLQVGQFESGAEMEGDLGRFYIEGRGGNGIQESYELFLYTMARHTSIDCFEKRGRKGYLFLIGDEKPYGKVNRQEVLELIGDPLQEDIPIEEIVREVQEKYNVFFIIPMRANGGRNPAVLKRWQELLGQNVLQIEDETGIAELIATQIGICEGVIDEEGAVRDLKETGTSTALVKAVTGAVNKNFSGGGTIAKLASGALSPTTTTHTKGRL